ncbi:MAG: RNA polymerase sigma factor [Acidobacteria bacterium]|nr:MAG: RNA polymerase sigma factor [Acidobacteriota bacterium]
MEMNREPSGQDREALVEKLEELHSSAFTWALHCCYGNRTEAEDVLQMVYLKILTEAARYDGRSTLKTWLYGVIRCTAREAHRRIARRLRLLHTWWSVRAEAQGPMAPELMHETEVREYLKKLLAALSSRQREVIELVFYHDLTLEQAAAVMGISIGSVRVHYERGKENLRRRLGRSEEQYDRARRGKNQAAF